VQYYAPKLQKRLKWVLKGGSYHTWHLDETYVQVKGEWKYLYRVVDARGKTLDFHLSHTRDAQAAKCFLGKLLRGRTGWDLPVVINTDKAPIYGLAIQDMKNQSKLPENTRHRQVKYLNNRIEADHGKLKRLIKPTSEFKSMKTARAALQGYEAMHSLRKGQARAFQLSPGIQGEVRLIERCFHLGPNPMAEMLANSA
jgi:transposase-like protein